MNLRTPIPLCYGSHHASSCRAVFPVVNRAANCCGIGPLTPLLTGIDVP